MSESLIRRNAEGLTQNTIANMLTPYINPIVTGMVVWVLTKVETISMWSAGWKIALIISVAAVLTFLLHTLPSLFRARNNPNQLSPAPVLSESSRLVELRDGLDAMKRDRDATQANLETCQSEQKETLKRLGECESLLKHWQGEVDRVKHDAKEQIETTRQGQAELQEKYIDVFAQLNGKKQQFRDLQRDKEATDQALIESRSSVASLEQTLRVAQSQAEDAERLRDEIRLLKQQNEELEARGQKPCPAKWLHAIGENDRINIDYALKLRSIQLTNAVADGKRYVDFRFVFFNKSVYDVTIDDKLGGDIVFGNEVIITEKRMDSHSSTNCRPRSVGVFIIRQWLNSAEIEDIKNFPESTAFRFNGLYVRIVGGTDFPEVVAKGLRIEGSVSVEAPLWVDNEC